MEEFISNGAMRENTLKKIETKISLSDKEFKAVLIWLLTELWKRIDEYSENVHKEENIQNNIKKNPVTKVRNKWDIINNRQGDTGLKI